VTPPKFGRDAMNIDDIEGSRSIVRWNNSTAKAREVNKTDDILGTKSIERHRMRKDQNYSNMDYRDVTKPDKVSNRCINPLNPVYTVPGGQFNIDSKDSKLGKDEPWYEIGPVDGSSPTLTVNAPQKKNKEHTSLITKDISGATAGSKGLGVFGNVTRRDGHMSSGLDNSNIVGSQADSLKKCPQTKRVTNPLDGNYQYPGHTEANNDNPYSDPKKKANALAQSGSN